MPPTSFEIVEVRARQRHEAFDLEPRDESAGDVRTRRTRGTGRRFYSQIRKYHHEGGEVYWSMGPTPESTTLINRCDEAQTYEARLAYDDEAAPVQA